MKEEWKLIDGYEDYLISNCGRVKTLEREVRYTHAVTGKEHFRKTTERFLKVYDNNRTGYRFVQLYKNKKASNKTIHRLVAENFIKQDEGFEYVNHIDGNKHNNRVDNLEWCTNEYNHEHATKTGLKPRGEQIGTSKLTEREVDSIRILCEEGLSDGLLANAFHVSRSTINLIRHGKAWVALTGEELEIDEQKLKEAVK
jgi:hypothetical protein